MVDWLIGDWLIGICNPQPETRNLELETLNYDYIIIGNGLAGLQLGLAFAGDGFFRDKQIALLDKSDKTENDKTWCFWEKGNGSWDQLVAKSWEKAQFFSSGKYMEFDLSPYRYKMLRAIDFYNFAKVELQQHSNIHFVQEEVLEVSENENVHVKTNLHEHSAKHVFDSRIPEKYFSPKDHHVRIHQHFKGWLIETPEKEFNPGKFTIMDFRQKFDNTTSFGYVLPVSEKKAVVEYTFFTPFITSEKIYEEMLQKYIHENLRIKKFEILETEKGVIPMTDFPFEKSNTEKITKIGTGGGWVKGSTGYSFKHTEKKTAKILENLKTGKNPSTGLGKKRYKFYDKIFLRVLQRHNEMGEEIFEKFYGKNTIQEVFAYLDEETSPSEDFKIMKSLYSKEFVKALLG
jgi:lycopene beta-cyclase